MDGDTRRSVVPGVPWSRRRLLALGVVLLVAVVGVAAFLILRDDARSPYEVVERDDPVEDLLGWLPADDQMRRSFAVWTGQEETPPAAFDAQAQQDLGLVPFPTSIGLSAGWQDRFGYAA